MDNVRLHGYSNASPIHDGPFSNLIFNSEFYRMEDKKVNLVFWLTGYMFHSLLNDEYSIPLADLGFFLPLEIPKPQLDPSLH